MLSLSINTLLIENNLAEKAQPRTRDWGSGLCLGSGLRICMGMSLNLCQRRCWNLHLS